MVVDNLSNSNVESLHRAEKICGKTIKFYEKDLVNKEEMSRNSKNSGFSY